MNYCVGMLYIDTSLFDCYNDVFNCIDTITDFVEEIQ